MEVDLALSVLLSSFPALFHCLTTVTLHLNDGSRQRQNVEVEDVESQFINGVNIMANFGNIHKNKIFRHFYTIKTRFSASQPCS